MVTNHVYNPNSQPPQVVVVEEHHDQHKASKSEFTELSCSIFFGVVMIIPFGIYAWGDPDDNAEGS